MRQYTPPGGAADEASGRKEALAEAVDEARWHAGPVRLDPAFWISDLAWVDRPADVGGSDSRLRPHRPRRCRPQRLSAGGFEDHLRRLRHAGVRLVAGPRRGAPRQPAFRHRFVHLLQPAGDHRHRRAPRGLRFRHRRGPAALHDAQREPRGPGRGADPAPPDGLRGGRRPVGAEPRRRRPRIRCSPTSSPVSIATTSPTGAASATTRARSCGSAPASATPSPTSPTRRSTARTPATSGTSRPATSGRSSSSICSTRRTSSRRRTARSSPTSTARPAARASNGSRARRSAPVSTARASSPTRCSSRRPPATSTSSSAPGWTSASAGVCA